VSSFYPGHDVAFPTIASDRTRFAKDWHSAVETDGSDGQVESEDDWFDKPQQAEQPQKGAPKTLDILSNEVGFFFSLVSTYSQLLL
jgi:hypothetical protein